MKQIRWTIDSPPVEAAAYLRGTIWLRASDGRRFVADFERDTLTEADFTVEHPFAEGFGFVRRGEALETLELMDGEGHVLAAWTMPPGGQWFLPRAPFSQGMCPVMTHEQRFGFLNTAGEMAIEPQYWLVEGFTEGYARVLPEGRREVRRGRLINLKGEVVKHSKGVYLSGVHGGCCLELLDRRSIRLTYGLGGGVRGRTDIEVRGDAYLPQDWQGEAMIPYRGKRLFSKLDVGLLHLFRGEAGPLRWAEASQSRCGRSRVSMDEQERRVTFADERFETIGGAWRAAQGFSEGVCAVLGGHGRWSFIDVDGSAAFVGAFEEATAMYRGAALVRTGERWGAIDRAGRFLTERGEWDEVYAIGEAHECFLARRGEKRFVILRASLRDG